MLNVYLLGTPKFLGHALVDQLLASTKACNTNGHRAYSLGPDLSFSF